MKLSGLSRSWAGKALFSLALAANCASAAPIAGANGEGSAGSNLTLPYSIATSITFGGQSLYVLPNGGGIAVAPMKTVSFEATNGVGPPAIVYTLSGSSVVSAIQQSSSVIIIRGNNPSTSVATTPSSLPGSSIGPISNRLPLNTLGSSNISASSNGLGSYATSTVLPNSTSSSSTSITPLALTTTKGTVGSSSLLSTSVPGGTPDLSTTQGMVGSNSQLTTSAPVIIGGSNPEPTAGPSNDGDHSDTRSSSSSCISSSTVYQVSVNCVSLSFTVENSFTSTIPCSTFTAATISGCSVTGTTTTVSSSTSASPESLCAYGACGDACSGGAVGPHSSGSMNLIATENCASISTSIASVLPSVSYAVPGGTTAAAARPRSMSTSAAAPSTREFSSGSISKDGALLDSSVVERALPDPDQPYGNYVQRLETTWIPMNAYATSQFFEYSPFGHSTVGVKDLWGCTAVIIASNKGAYVSHIWEKPVFVSAAAVHTDDEFFTTNAFITLRDGSAYTYSITSLVGDAQNPGPLNAIYSPQIFLVTPYTSFSYRQKYGVTSLYKYQNRVHWLGQQISSILPGTGGEYTISGYNNIDKKEANAAQGYAGRAILEADPDQYRLKLANDPADPGLQMGRWRLWTEDRMTTFYDFVTPALGSIQQRDISYADSCGNSTVTDSWTAVPVSSGSSTWDSLSPVATPSVTSQSLSTTASTCVLTTVMGPTTVADTSGSAMSNIMCLCDSSIVVDVTTVTGSSSVNYLVCALQGNFTSTVQPTLEASSTTSASPTSIPPATSISPPTTTTPPATSSAPASVSSSSSSQPSCDPNDCRCDSQSCYICQICLEHGPSAGQCTSDPECNADQVA